MNETQTQTIPIAGMDCANCARFVRHAIAVLDGIESVDVHLGSEKAIVCPDPAPADLSAIRIPARPGHPGPFIAAAQVRAQ
jgi:Cd2+/Zn2+-exporting ATPase/Cu+-exporting ATPase